MQNILFYLGYCYYLLLVRTVRARLVGEHLLHEVWDSGKNLIFCTPHHFLFALFVGIDAGKMRRPIVTLIVSRSSDGELISRLLRKQRFNLVRGSSNRGAQSALLGLQKASKDGQSIGIAFDGPKGPPLIPKRGVVACARVVSGPIFLVYGYAKPNGLLKFLKPFRVKSWDKFLILVPFCSVEIHFEKIPEKNEVGLLSEAEYEKYVLSMIEKRSRQLYGDLYQA